MVLLSAADPDPERSETFAQIRNQVQADHPTKGPYPSQNYEEKVFSTTE